MFRKAMIVQAERDQLLSWHGPTGDGSEGWIYLSQGRAYDSSSLRDSDDAINRLESIRARGAQYLLFPTTAFCGSIVTKNFVSI